jgi:hypothetical protein
MDVEADLHMDIPKYEKNKNKGEIIDMPKYTTRQSSRTLSDEQYRDLFEDREVETITFHENYSFSSDFVSKEYAVREHIWSHGDKLYKLAIQYYGNRDMYWMIGLFNNKPTDAHYKYGDVVSIPVNGTELYRDMVK